MNIMALNRISKVIQTEATTTSKGDFLLTHLPFENLYLENGKSISENELLKNVMLKKHSDHKFIMVQGGNGSGKSHLIRWLKEMYQNSVDDSEAVLLISRAHNTLQDALSQLLEADIFPDEIKENELKHIKNAKSNITGEELNKTINFNFTLEIDADSSNQNAMIDGRIRKWLCTYLMDPFIINEFLLIPNGPIERIRAKIETTNEGNVVLGDSPSFVADDFNISFSQIKQNLHIANGRAADFTIRLAEKFSDLRTGAELRQKVADYLNTKVSGVIQRSLKLQTADFKKLFASLRKILKRQGMNLSLFVEDINSFTGIDEALMEVLLTDHSADGNSEYCRLISVVGSTNAFFRDKLNASIKERIKTNIYIKEHSVLGTKEQLCKFAAKYINAINLTEEEVSEWELSGASNDELPIFESPHEFAKIDCGGKLLSIFPFNENALWNLYLSLPIDEKSVTNPEYKRTPRVFLKSVIAHVLKLWYVDPESFLSDYSNFSNADIKNMPNWSSPLYNQTNISIDESSAIERGILLRLWGDGTAKSESGRLGGLTGDVFKAFNVYSNISGAPNPVAKQVTDPSVSITPEVISTTPIEKHKSTKNQSLVSIEEDLHNWLYPKDPTKTKLSNHIELRELLSNFITSGIDWEVEGVPTILVNSYINTRGRIHIEGQSQQIGEGLLLKRNEDSYYLLTSLAYFKYLGENTWSFDDCEDYLVTATAWLERHREEIIETIVAPKNQREVWNLPLWNTAAIYCIRTLFGGIDISKSSEDFAIELLSTKVNFNEVSTHSDSWSDLQKVILNNNRFKEIVYNDTLRYFSKSVGSAKAGETNYVFVDALELLQQIRKLKSLNFDLSGLCPTDIDNFSSTWYHSANLINTFNKNLTAILSDENEKANNYLSFFSGIFSNDFSDESISLSLQSIREFLKFLTETLNLSYIEDDYKVLKPSTASTKLLTAIGKIQKLNEQQKSSETLMRISKNPFEDIEKFYMALLSFNKLLNDKEEVFNKYVDMESKQAIGEHKNKILANVDIMLQSVENLGGDISGDD